MPKVVRPAHTVDQGKKYCPTCALAEWTKKSKTGQPVYQHGGICRADVVLPHSYRDPTRPEGRRWPKRRPVSFMTEPGCAFWRGKDGEDN